MNRAQFMEQLKRLLIDISEAEREEALEYYESYFDDAGAENEASVIQELGSPGKVAAIIKADLNESNENYAEYTERGYEDTRTKEEQVPDQYTTLSAVGAGEKSQHQEGPQQEGKQQEGQQAQWQQREAQRQAERERQRRERQQQRNERAKSRAETGYHVKERKTSGKVVLIIILLIFLAPLIKGTVGGILGVVLTILLLPFLIVFAVGMCTLGLVLGAIATAVAGIVLCFTYPAAGILTIGIGCFLMAAGLLALILLVWLAGKVLPKFLRKLTDFCHNLVSKERKDGAGV